MKERPILFSGPMVRAILRPQCPKTQTRRVIQFPKHAYDHDPDVTWIKSVHQDGTGDWIAWSFDAPDAAAFTKRAYPTGGGFPCRYGRPGDRLWVRETWQTDAAYDPCAPSQIDSGASVFLLADERAHRVNHRAECGPMKWGKTRTSIHMPRWASRINLLILNIRAERLQSITEEDAHVEGVVPIGRDGHGPITYRNGFSAEWERINYHRGSACSWHTNPWVWVIGFSRLEGALNGKQQQN